MHWTQRAGLRFLQNGGSKAGKIPILRLPNPSGYITVYPPKMIERLEEKVSSQPERSSGSVVVDGTVLEGGFFWMRQTGQNQSERQTFGARRHKRKAVLVGKFSSFAIWSEDRREAEDDAPQERNIFDAMRELGL